MMKNFLRSLALVTLATMGVTAVNAHSELRENGNQMHHQCSMECKAKCARLNNAINQVPDLKARKELREMLEHKMKMHRELKCKEHKLEWLEENMCSKCKHNFDKHVAQEKHEKMGHKGAKCAKCAKCKHDKHGQMSKEKEHKKHEHVRKYKKVKEVKETEENN